MTGRAVTAARWVAGSLAASLAVAGCAAGNSATHHGAAAPQGRALPATAPSVQLDGAGGAYLVWPSGSAWLVLRSTDGFRTVQSLTPPAVETTGGLVGDFAAPAPAVAVGPTEQLLRSPLLTARAPGRWSPGELPGAVIAVRGAVAVRPGKHGGSPTAVLDSSSGTLVQRTKTGWRRVTSGARLSPGGGLRMQTVTWLRADTGVITGTSHGTALVAFRTADGGGSWHAVRGLPPGALTALPPCRSAGQVVLPVITRAGAEVMLRSNDNGASWVSGARFTAASGIPAYGCSAAAVWTAARARGAAVVLTSHDAGSAWRIAGTAPRGLTSLAPGDAGAGYATAGGDQPRLYAVRDDARRFRSVPLPGWVAAIGQQTATH